MKRSHLFFYFSDATYRRNVIKIKTNAKTQPILEYLLYGLPGLEKLGYKVQHNLEGNEPPQNLWSMLLQWINRFLHRIGAYGGDFATILRSRRKANRADLIISTVDSVGIPLVLLKCMGLIRTPILYVSIGLPERLPSIRKGVIRNFYRWAFTAHIKRIITYGYAEAERLKEWFCTQNKSPEVTFVPFGVDTEYFKTVDKKEIHIDVLSVGRDFQRDFESLIQAAKVLPNVSFLIVTSKAKAKTFKELPINVNVLHDLEIDEVRQQYACARIVVLPVKENSYSGATTTLLQAMAMGKPVVVSRVGAIRNGYGLKDGVNCRMVVPCDSNSIVKAVSDLIEDEKYALDLGLNARRHVQKNLSWKQYIEKMKQLIENTMKKNLGNHI